MPTEIFESYRHSGKYSPHVPVMIIAAALALGFPLGFAYAYLMKWIPFIILRVFGTAGYGMAFGLLVSWLVKSRRVRNTFVASLCGLAAGLAGLYFAWSAYVFTQFTDAPVLCPPSDLVAAMSYLLKNGSWALSGSDRVTDVPLAIVWLVEAGIITGLATLLPFGTVSETPYCEQSQCWLDSEKKIDTIEAFNDPVQHAAFKRGDLSPLLEAKPRAAETVAFSRLTLKHSPLCEVFCTMRIENVTLKKDKEGNVVESRKELTRNLVLPQRMLGLIAKFESFQAPVQEELPKAA